MSKFKAFGLALLAIGAMSAIAAQGAMAVTNHSFESEQVVTVLTGESTNVHRFVATNRPIRCNTATFTGTTKEKVADEVTVHPKYSGDCTVEGTGVSVTVDTDGCNYVFDSDTTPNGEAEDAPVEIECEEGHEITVTAPGCTIHVPPQKVHGVSFANEGSGETADLVVTATVTGITYTVTELGFCFLLGLGEGTHHDGTYTGTATVKGFEDEGVIADNPGETTSNTTVGTEYKEGSQIGIKLITP